MIKRPYEKEDIPERGMFRQDRNTFCSDRNRKDPITFETQERGLLEKELRERGLLGHEIRRRSMESDHMRLKNINPEDNDSFEEAAERAVRMRELELKDEIEFYRQSKGAFMTSPDYVRSIRDREFRDARDIREMIELRRNHFLQLLHKYLFLVGDQLPGKYAVLCTQLELRSTEVHLPQSIFVLLQPAVLAGIGLFANIQALRAASKTLFRCRRAN